MLINQKNISTAIQDCLATMNYSKVFVLVDENTRKHCLPLIEFKTKFIIIEIESGEKNKNLETCQHIWSELLKHQADRNAILLNLGGGVICDMGAFCASTYKRGIRFINIPTTLLAQVDASVGSKTGIDFQGQKNMIGLFSEAKEVIIDIVFLNTLVKRQLLSGFAEVLKHGLIIDRSYFDTCIETFFSKEIKWKDIIEQSILIKTNIVTKDPKEKGLRKILNFGHTIGHALESYSLKNHTNPLLHGEAVILGMIAELHISSKKIGLEQEKRNLVVEKLLKIYNFTKLEAFDYDSLIQYIYNDKKNTHNKIKAVLLSDIGNAQYDCTLELNDIKESLSYLFKMVYND